MSTGACQSGSPALASRVTWENEGGTGWVADFKKDGVPADLDIVSLDDYYMGAGPIAEVAGHRKFYEDEIYPCGNFSFLPPL